MRHRITAFGVACAFLICCIVAIWVMATFFSGCALLQIGQHYKTFELTIDGEKVVVNLPKDFPSIDKAINTGERCWDAKLCGQQFCLSDETIHGHVRFFYSGKKVVALGWQNKKEELRHWLYVKGIPIEVDYQKLKEALDLIWRSPKTINKVHMTIAWAD